MANSMDESSVSEIKFQLHPRIFEALGSRLVTSDIVAIIELVKNSYDAMATRVDVRFDQLNQNNELCLEINDNGTGMTRSIIENVWAVIATPHRQDTPISEFEGRTRRVSGEKGLGRLSAARLGNSLALMTKAENEPCWRLEVAWDELISAESMDTCVLKLESCDLEWRNGTGTHIRISDLKSDWTEDRVQELKDQLSRLVSPFSGIEDFEIWFYSPFDKSTESILITPPDFLTYPPYKINGSVDEGGHLQAEYSYLSATGERERGFTEQLTFQAREHTIESKLDLDGLRTACNSFEFEIRAWDLDSDSIENIADRFDATKSTIRKNISNFRGISLYRDGILVLPKTDATRDWLGLDIRRVSRVGVRLSTSQIVGYISISADRNKDLRDTSDRERLENNSASWDFEELVKQIIEKLEDERSRDRISPDHKEPPFRDLFEGLNVDGLVEQVQSLAEEKAPAGEVLRFVESHRAQVDKTVDQIQRRLYYYSRLASLGTLSAMILHEVRNHTTVLGRLTRNVKKQLADSNKNTDLYADLDLAEKSIRAIERMADRFAPLASRAARTRRRDSILEEVITDTVAIFKNDIEKLNIEVAIPKRGETLIPVDPGELSSLFFNLIDNSIYWLGSSKSDDRRIEIKVERRKKYARVKIRIDDSGPGVPDGEEERILWPGITSKPEGIGMGLTVAAEIVSQYGGKLFLIKPGYLGGASFGFDLPMKV